MKWMRKAPLFAVLLITGILFTVVAVLGWNKGYKDYHKDENIAEQPLLSVVFRGLHDNVYPWGEKESAAQKEAEALLSGNDDGAAEASTQEAVDSSAAESDTAETADTEDTASTESSTEAATQEEVDLTIPDGVNSPVVQAIDYGNSDAAYLTPEGKTWKKDTDGIFASNGTYYYLQQVDDNYFQDAIFIGDSRTEGLYVYSSMKDLTSFDAKDSATIYNIYDRALDFYGIDGSTGSKTAMEALQEKQYRKVYFSVGINELGMPTEDYFDKYQEFVQVIRKLQPDAIIYVEGIMHVTGSYAQANTVYNNTNIVDKNTALATLANGHDIFYIDMNSAVCDQDGNLPEGISYDGVHLKASAYESWHQFLLENAIVRSDEDWTPAPAPTPAAPDTGSTGIQPADGTETGTAAAETSSAKSQNGSGAGEGLSAAAGSSVTGTASQTTENVSAE